MASISSSFLLAFTPSVKTLESNIVSKSLVLNKILHKHMDNGIKNMKKIPKHRILKKKKMKNKNYYERKNHVKDALRLEGERFVKTN